MKEAIQPKFEKTTITCACGNVEVKDKVQATGHAWDKGVIKKEATAAAVATIDYHYIPEQNQFL